VQYKIVSYISSFAFHLSSYSFLFIIKRKEKISNFSFISLSSLAKLERHCFVCIIIICFLNVLIDRIIYLQTTKTTIVTLHYECYDDIWLFIMNVTMTYDCLLWMLRWHTTVYYECCDDMCLFIMNVAMTYDCLLWILRWHVTVYYECCDDIWMLIMNVTMTCDCLLWMLRWHMTVYYECYDDMTLYYECYDVI